MSSFNCLVIHREEQDIADLMAPYSEELIIKPYIRETKENCYRKYLQAKNDAKNKPGSFFAKKQKEEADIIGMSFERFKRWYWGESRIWDKEGNLLTAHNPKGRWHYYTVGGRWEDLLLKKDGSRGNRCLVCEVDWDNLLDPEKDKKYYQRIWDVIMKKEEEITAKEREEFRSWLISEAEYYQKFYRSKEEFVKRNLTFTTFAVVTPDGKWHSRGKMLYFGISDETEEGIRNWVLNFYGHFIKPYLSKGYLVTVLDCRA